MENFLKILDKILPFGKFSIYNTVLSHDSIDIMEVAYMLSIDLKALNPREKHMHETLLAKQAFHDSLRITQAAELCDCSVSKISKFVKKLGFQNFKQYRDFLSGKTIEHKAATHELQRVKQFLSTFDTSLVDDLYMRIMKHNKIILFGYGPSLLCAQYFEYRFRNCSDKVTMAVSDEVAIDKMVDDSTLLIIITETGRFHSFERVYASAKSRGCEVVMIVEEYHTELMEQCDRIFWLSTESQPANLKAYEKSRTLFFIFLEEIIQRFLMQDKDFPVQPQ
jgi:DNA-binding MurR/RpiR family transcriptional regulator